MAKRRFEFRKGKSAKFWQITVRGDLHIIEWGRIGTKGQATVKSFPDAKAARVAAEKQIAKKTAKGYQAAGKGAAKPKKESGSPAPAPRAKAAKKKPAKKTAAKKKATKKTSGKSAGKNRATYYVLDTIPDDTHVLISDNPNEFEDSFYLTKKGVPLSGEWPENVKFRYAEEHKQGTILADAIDNTLLVLITSPRFRELLEALELDGAECLSCTLVNHKGRATAKDYCMVNLYPLVSAVDREKSEFDLEPLRPPDGIDEFTKLALRTDVKLPLLFRLEEQPMLILVHESVVKKAQDAKLTGLIFIPTDKYETFFAQKNAKEYRAMVASSFAPSKVAKKTAKKTDKKTAQKKTVQRKRSKRGAIS